MARYGDLDALALFFGLEATALRRWQYRWCLQTETWKSHMFGIRTAAREMKDVGL
jgi:hypothetical protein